MLLMQNKPQFFGSSSDFWISSEGLHIAAHSTKHGIDTAMVEIEFNSDNMIFDSRTLPWLSHNEPLSIWLESSFESRVLKALISFGPESKFDYSEVAERLSTRDAND